MALNYPDLIPGVFAAQAADHENIPDTNAGTGRMAWDVGFPSETSQPVAVGGVPPRRLDMNGLGNKLSQHIMWQQSGGQYMWDATLDYPPYAHVIGSDGNEYIASAPSGPSQGSGAVNPVTDVTFTKWKSWQRSIVDLIYPVGSIYMSFNSVSPATLFGGTWLQITGRFILASSTNYPAQSTGGSVTHALTVNEMPSHTHAASTDNAGNHSHAATNATNGDHTHTVTVNNGGAHTHTTFGTAASAGAHTHSISITNGAQSAGAHTHSVAKAAQTVSVNTGSAGAHTHNITINATSMTTGNAGSHTHTRGSMNITGSLVGDNEMVQSAKGCFVDKGFVTGRGAGNDDVAKKLEFDASKTWAGSTSSNGAHTHSVTFPQTTVASTSAGAHTHSVSITVPAQTLTAASGGAHTHNLSGTTASAGAHTHTTTGTAASAGTHNHGASTVTAGNHTHTITVNNNGTHAHTVNVANAGGNVAFSIMPPYLAVNVWRRTA